MANKALIAKARMGVQARFDDELRGFLYAFAGDSDPQKDTVDLLNDMTVDIIAKTTAEAVNVARSVGCPLNHESVLFTVRNDPLKRERMNELLHSFDEIKRLRTAHAKDLAGNLKKMAKTASNEKIEKPGVAGGPSGQKKEKRSANPKPPGSAEKPKRTKKPKDPSKSTPSSSAKSPAASGGGSETGKPTTAAMPSSSAAAPMSSEPQQTEFMM